MNNYKQKYLKYKQKYINLKDNMIGGACSKCPIMGFQQHLGECWHDAISTIMLFNDGICDIIQPIFANDIETIITQINKNIDENKIPDYYLPLNIEPSEIVFFQKKIIEYIRESYFRYHNVNKDIISDELKQNIKKFPLLRQPSLECSLELVHMAFDIHNNNNTNITIFDDNSHGGFNFYEIIMSLIFNYTLMNYNRSDTITENKYICPYELNFHKYNFYILEQSKKNYLEILNIYIDNIKHIISLLNENKILAVNILLHVNKSAHAHAQAFIKCNDKLYFYDDNGITTIVNSKLGTEEINKKSSNLNTTLVEFNWIDYLKNKLNIIIQRIENELLSLPEESFNSEFIFTKLNEIIKILSGFYLGHEDEITFGYKMLENMFIYKLTFFTIENEQNETDYYNKMYKTNFLNYDNDRNIKYLLSNINSIDDNCIYFINGNYITILHILNKKNYRLLYELVLKYNKIDIFYIYYDEIYVRNNSKKNTIINKKYILKILEYILINNLEKINDYMLTFINDYGFIKFSIAETFKEIRQNIEFRETDRDKIDNYYFQADEIIYNLINFIINLDEYKIKEAYTQDYKTHYDLIVEINKDIAIPKLIKLFEDKLKK
jgi:hypothetical protein